MDLITRKQALMAGACIAFLLGGTPVQVFASNASVPVEASAPTQKVVGTVVDQSGDPIIGANVLVKGTQNGTITDFDGHFTIEAPKGATLVVSYIGYLQQEVKVTGDNLKIQLAEDSKSLEEVVVVGYGVQKKKLVTGATVQVKGDEIAKMNTTNALTAMQSSTPGVQITQASSQPGKGFKVNIRGMGTINGASPLLVIDGVQSGTADDGLNGLNPNDIESIDVLKDAASAAIYGAHAANGVILVTTKQGKAGKLSIQYDGHVGWSNAYKRPATLNAKQYMQIIDELNFGATGTKTDWSELVPQAILDKVNAGWEGTDWFDEYANKNAVQTNHALSITGGNDRSKFSMSLNYSYNNGIMGGAMASNYQRYGGRINSEHVLLRGKHDIITIGENLSYWYHKSHDLAEGNGYFNIMQNAYIASPLVQPFNEDGSLASFRENGAGYSSMIYTNPLNGLYNGEYNAINKSRDFGVGATFYWIIEPIKGLRYRGQVNTGYSGSNTRSASQPYSSSNTNATNTYGLQYYIDESGSISVNNTISYELPKFNGHAIDLMVGQEYSQKLWNNSLNTTHSIGEKSANSLLTKGFSYNLPVNYGIGSTINYNGSADTEYAEAAFFGRVNYNYKEKYMATFILRHDGSSNFADGHRWGTFPSVSGGWVVTNESFMEPIQDVMDFFKIRASWGQNGNCNVTPFSYLANIKYSPTDYADYGYKFGSSNEQTVSPTGWTPGAYTDNMPNEDLTWETSEQINIGFDARFLNSRLGVNFDYYVKTTKDWLICPTPKAFAGTPNGKWLNGGDVRNSGVELALSWNDKIGSDFNYHANVNIGTNRNRVTYLATDGGRIDGQKSALFQNSDYVSRVEVGHAIGYFYGMDYDGIWQNQAQIDEARAAGKAVLDNAQPGDMIWVDYNGDGKINYDEDRHDIGNPHPNVTLGLAFGFDYKGFDFNIAGSGAFGQQVMQCYRTALLANQYQNYTEQVFDRWHGEGTSNTQPRLTVGSVNDQWVSTRYMQNADFFKIQNVTVGYDFKKLLKTCPFGQLRVYFQAQNLYTFTGYKGVDPEVGSNGGKDPWASGIDVGLYPSARTYLFGVSVKF